MKFIQELIDILKANYSKGKGWNGLYVGLVVLFCFAVAIAEIFKVAFG